jgi:hypothetical protein
LAKAEGWRPALWPIIYRVEPDRLLLKCEELLDTLYSHPDHAKLRRLAIDIEALRDRLLHEAGNKVTNDPRAPLTREE